MKRYSYLTLLAALAFNQATAGVIVLKNGDRITGTIKKIWDGDVFIEPEYADEFSIDQEDIAYMEDDRPMDIETADGDSVVASLVGADEAGNQLLVDEDGKEFSLPLATLAEMDEPEKYMDWEIRSDLNTSFDRGNTDSDEVKFSGAALYKRGKQKHILDWLYHMEENEDVTTKDRDLYRYTYNYELVEPWFAGASASYENDSIKGLDYRYNVVPAIGYNIWDNAGAILNVSLGWGYQSERTFEEPDTGGKIYTEEDGAVSLFLLRFLYDFNDPDLSLYATNSTSKAFYGRENTVTQFVTGLRYEITDLLYANFELDLDYESEPPEGKDNEDVTILFGLGIEFDN